MTDSIIVMGVAGCGKSSLGAEIARATGLPLVEGDDFHSAANRDKMKNGTPLTDEDRNGWLDLLAMQLQAHPGGVVLTCSSLKRQYRERLRDAAPAVRYVYLEIGKDDAIERVASRGSHFFSSSLVESQFETLESPVGEPRVLRLDAMQPLDRLTATSVAWLAQPAASGQVTADTAIAAGRWQRTSENLMAACMGVMALAVFTNVVLRYGFGDGIPASEELSRLLFVWMVFIGAAAAYPAGEHMAFTTLVAGLRHKPRVMRCMTVLIRLLTILACALLGWGAWQQVVVGLGSNSVVLGYSSALLPLPALLCAAAIGVMATLELLKGVALNLGHTTDLE